MYVLISWIYLIFFVKYSYPACSSTVAITTCSGENVKPNKPLHINDYRTYLSFTRGNLEQVPSGTFKFLPQVTILQLSFNKINTLEEDSFLGLQDLRELNLYENQLRAIEKNVFKQCRKLQKLDLGLNKISSIHDKAFENLVDLKFLNLGFNSLKSVPLAINTLPSLRILNLHNNEIDNLKANTFSGLDKLEELSFGDNKIRSIENHSFKGLVNLKQLVLKSNYLTYLNVEDLVSDAGALQIVSISINEFKCKVLTEIVNKFKKSFIQVVRGVSNNPTNINGINCKV